ncbi:MAG: FHA domain-containing protein, partial [Candidatus Sulfotelmatobacter sp.]
MINPRLLSISGCPKETVRIVKDGPLILGRDPSNQLGVGDPSVSRKHCSVSEVSSGVFEIADLDSHNGTFVNGERVSRQTIEHGDRIRVGNSEFVFLTGPDEVTDPLSSRSGNSATNSEIKTMSLDRSGLPT